jgi:glycine hydroxymethyltransferase
LDWEKFTKIAGEVGAWLVADISHIAGLIVGGAHPSPVPYVHIITSTTHKSLRGPRAAIIGVTKKGVSFAKSYGILDLPKLIDRAVFPGLQGGPHMNSIAAMAVAFAEADTPEFKKYAQQIVKNAKALAESLKKEGLKVFGTENHLMVVDCGLERPTDSDAVLAGRGKEMAVKLEEAGIIVNANTIPHDEAGPFKPSGIRIGVPAMTTKGYCPADFEVLGTKIARIIKG